MAQQSLGNTAIYLTDLMSVYQTIPQIIYSHILHVLRIQVAGFLFIVMLFKIFSRLASKLEYTGVEGAMRNNLFIHNIIKLNERKSSADSIPLRKALLKGLNYPAFRTIKTNGRNFRVVRIFEKKRKRHGKKRRAAVLLIPCQGARLVQSRALHPRNHINIVKRCSHPARYKGILFLDP